MPERWLTVGAAAKMLGVSPDTVKRRAARGELERRQEPTANGTFRWLVKLEPTPTTLAAVPHENGALIEQLREENAWLRGQLDKLHARLSAPPALPAPRVSWWERLRQKLPSVGI